MFLFTIFYDSATTISSEHDSTVGWLQLVENGKVNTNWNLKQIKQTNK